jgi:DNA invertase Pin-like site-specific DNA recombinase
MRVALYARVSTQRQAQAQSVEQQLDGLKKFADEQGWRVPIENVFRDDGYSGASLKRLGLDRLRDQAAARTLDLVLITAPDRLARNYVHQVLLLEELEQHGCQVQFLDRPMSHDPHDQLLLQIRGVVAEYERTLITERMRRGRQRKLAGSCCPGRNRLSATVWTRTVHAIRPAYGSKNQKPPLCARCLLGMRRSRTVSVRWPACFMSVDSARRKVWSAGT